MSDPEEIIALKLHWLKISVLGAFVLSFSLSANNALATENPSAQQTTQIPQTEKASPPASHPNSSPAQETTGTQLSSANVMEPVQVDPTAPSIPLAVDKNINNKSFTLEQARKDLEELEAAQAAMAKQMEALKARIQQTQGQEEVSQGKLDTLDQQTQANNTALETLAKRTQLHGYVEMGWRMYNRPTLTDEYLGANLNQKGNTFDLRRVTLQPEVDFTDKLHWYGEVEFEDAGADEITVEECVLSYNYKPALNFHAGLMVPEITYTALNHEGPRRLLVDRPLMDFFVVPTTYRDLGVGITGTFPIYKRSTGSYELDVVNGFNDNLVSSITPGSHLYASDSVDFAGMHTMQASEVPDLRYKDNNSNKAVFGRLGFSPFPGLQLGVSAHVGDYDANNQKKLALIGADALYRYKKFSFLGEYANAMLQRGDGISSVGIPFNRFPTSMNGYFLQAAYDLTPKLTAVTAWNGVNLDQGQKGNIMHRLSVGARYEIARNVFFKLEYQFTTPRESLGSAGHFSNALIAQITFAY